MPGDFAIAMRAYHVASMPVLNDAAVWREECQRDEPRLMAWPRPYRGTKFNRLLSVLFNADVDVVLAILRSRDDPMSPAWPPDVRDPKMQVVLRVVQRAMDAGCAAMLAAFDGERVTGRREYMNRALEDWTELAMHVARRDSLTRDQAFELFDIPRRQAFRAIKRASKRK